MHIDQKTVDKTIKTLNKLSRSALPIATRNTLNDLAFKSRLSMQEQMRKDFTLRTKWTERSVRVNRANQYNIADMKSETGSIAPYMETQYKGGRVKAKHKNKPIGMKKARVSSSPYKSVRSAYRMKNVQFGGRVFHSDKTKKPGIFITKGKGKRRKMHKLWDLSNTSVSIKKQDWMSPAVRRYYNKSYVDRIFMMNAIKQIKRLTK